MDCSACPWAADRAVTELAGTPVLTALMTPMAAAGLFMLLGPGLGLVALPAEEVEKMAGILKV